MGEFDDLFKKLGIPMKITFLGKEYESNPDALVFSQRGMDKYLQGEYSDAVVEFTKAINALPSNQNFYTMRGTAYEDMGNDIEAEKDFKKSLELLPGYLSSYRLGMVFRRKGDIESSIKYLKISYEDAPDICDIDIGSTNNILFVGKHIIAGNLGNLLVQQKKHDEAMKYLDKAIELEPKYPNPYCAKGIALTETGKISEGLLYLEKAAELGFDQAKKILNVLKQGRI